MVKIVKQDLHNDLSSLQGKFLVSHPNISDSRFYKTIIYIVEHSINGSLGVIINKPSAYSFSNLISNLSISETLTNTNEIKNTLIKRGGPVNSEQLLVLHSEDYKTEHTKSITQKISVTRNKEVIEDILKGKGPLKTSIFIGNATWLPMQLVFEIKNDTWFIYNGSTDLIFNNNYSDMWSDICYELGIPNYTLATFYNASSTTLQ